MLDPQFAGKPKQKTPLPVKLDDRHHKKESGTVAGAVGSYCGSPVRWVSGPSLRHTGAKTGGGVRRKREGLEDSL